MAQVGAPLVDVVDYCKISSSGLNATRLKAPEVQDSWRSRRVALEGILDSVSHGS